MYTFGNLELAKEVEYFMALDDAAYVSALNKITESNSFASFKFESGLATYAGKGPQSNTHGFGTSDLHNIKVLKDIESFFAKFKVSPVISLASVAKPEVINLLFQEGYSPVFFMNLYVMSNCKEINLDNNDIKIKEVTLTNTSSRELWSKVVSCGFSDRTLDLNSSPDSISSGQAAKEGNKLYIAYIHDEIAGAASLYMNKQFARLGGMTTLPDFRGRGVQKALINHRTIEALHNGCTIITTDTIPGTVSQMNVEKLGYKIAYTRAIYKKTKK